MDNVRCIAIDDEPLALGVISKFCERMGGVDLSVYSDPSEGIEAIRRERPAVVFLDIEMGNISGISIAEMLPPETCLIFTTAYMDYALKGFELDAVDYLHKPFAYDRFVTAFGKALRRIGLRKEHDTPQSITVKREYNNVTIALEDILYIEAMEGYVKIFLTGGECVVSRVILKNIGSQLPEGDFMRIHRSFIVRKSKIKSFNKREVTLVNGKSIPVGRLYASALDALLH